MNNNVFKIYSTCSLYVYYYHRSECICGLARHICIHILMQLLFMAPALKAPDDRLTDPPSSLAHISIRYTHATIKNWKERCGYLKTAMFSHHST